MGTAVLSVMRQVLVAVLKFGTGLVVLAMIAFSFSPPHSDYTTRSKISEGLSVAVPVKLAVGDAYSRTGKLPEDNRAAGLPPPAAIRSRYVTSINIRNGVISILLSDYIGGYPSMDGVTLTLTPAKITPEAIEWKCAIGGDSSRYKYVPSECRQ
jgi:hypothetical protein